MDTIDWMFHMGWITPLLVLKMIVTVGWLNGVFDEHE